MLPIMLQAQSSQEFRSKKTNTTDSYLLTLVYNQDNIPVINTSIVLSDSNHRETMYLLDGSYLNSSNVVSIPNNGNYFWFVPFDNSNAPYIYNPNGNNSIEVRCDCILAVNPMECTVDVQLPCVECKSEACEGCKLIELGKGIIIQAASIYYNNVHYLPQ